MRSAASFTAPEWEPRPSNREGLWAGRLVRLLVLSLLMPVALIGFFAMPALAQTCTVLPLSPATATNKAGQTHTVTSSSNVPGSTLVTFTAAGTGAEVPNFATRTYTFPAATGTTFSFSSTRTGTSTVTATIQCTAGTETETATKTWLSATPTTVTLEPESGSNQVGTSHTVTARVTDTFGNRDTGGTIVTFTVEGAGGRTATRTTSSTGTASGTATFTFSSTQAGISTITALAQSATSNSVNKTWTLGEGDRILLEPDSAANDAGSTHRMTATIQDEFGNTIPTSTTVTFTVTGEGATQTARTSNGGAATFTFSSTQAGRSTITATAQIGTQTVISNVATKDWAGKAVSIDLQPDSSTNNVNTTHSMTAFVEDDAGNPVADGTVVTFTVVGRGATQTTTTTENGEASLDFSSTQPGRSTITASAQGETQTIVSNVATKTWQTTSGSISLAPASDDNPIGTSHRMTATLTNKFGDSYTTPTVVTFTVNGEGATQTTVTSTGGQATFTFSSTQEGVSTITATAVIDGQKVASNVATKNWTCDPNAGRQPPTFGIDIARDVEFFNDCDGYVLDGFGGVHPVGDAELVEGLPSWQGFDIAREVVLVFNATGDVTGGYILDGWGGVHPFNTPGESAPPTLTGLPYFPGYDIGRDVHLSEPGATQTSGWLLDGFGGMHPFGDSPTLTGLPYFDGFDIAREIAFTPGEEDGVSGGYMLDGWGGMHPFGAKPTLTGLPYFPGNDVANDALLTGPDDGFMLDAYGGLHPFGSEGVASGTIPYTPGVDSYKAFDLMQTRGVVLNRFGTLFEWSP